MHSNPKKETQQHVVTAANPQAMRGVGAFLTPTVDHIATGFGLGHKLGNLRSGTLTIGGNKVEIFPLGCLIPN